MESESGLILLEQVRNGDRAALGKLLDELRPFIRVVVRSVRPEGPTGAKDDSDLIQEAMLQASQCVNTFRGASLGEWLGWLRTITVRTALRNLENPGWMAAGGSEADMATLVADPQLDPCQASIRQESASQMALAISRLPEDMQQVLLGRLIDNLDHARIAAQLGRSEGAVRMLYLRALRRLREIWETDFSSGASLNS